MTTKFSTLFGLILSSLVFLSNPCHSMTTVKVVIPNSFKGSEDILSASGRYGLDSNNLDFGFLLFDLESHVGNTMVLTAFIPTMIDVEKLFISVNFDTHSDTDYIHDVPVTEVNLNEGDVTFFRWIFVNSQNTIQDEYDDYIIGPDGELFLAIPADLIDSFFYSTENLIENLFSKYPNLERGNIDHGGFKYTDQLNFLDYINSNGEEIDLKSLETSLHIFMEKISFYSSSKYFSFDCKFDEGDLTIELFIK